MTLSNRFQVQRALNQLSIFYGSIWTRCNINVINTVSLYISSTIIYYHLSIYDKNPKITIFDLVYLRELLRYRLQILHT